MTKKIITAEFETVDDQEYDDTVREIIQLGGEITTERDQ